MVLPLPSLLRRTTSLCLFFAAATTLRAAEPPLATLVETVTGEAVPLRNNAVTNQASDMVKVCDLAVGGRFLFVCTYYSTTLCVFERDPATARLTLRQTLPNPYGTHWHWADIFTRDLPGGRTVLYYLYKGVLHWYDVDGQTATATLAGKIEKAGASPVVFAPDGRYLFTSDAVLVIDEKGAPSLAGRRKTAAAALAFSPDGRHLYEATHTRVAAYAYDAATGQTTETATLALTGQPDTPKPARTFMSISPDGRFLYVGQQSEGYGAKKKWHSWMLERSRETGALTVKSSGPPPRGLTNVESCLFAADGKSGFFIQADPVDGEGYRSCAAWFTRDPETGALNFQGKGPPARTCCMDYDPVHGHFYAGSCGQDARNSHIFVFKTAAATPPAVP